MRNLQRILVGLDLEADGALATEGSEAAARFAVELAGRVGACVEFLHVRAEDALPLPRANARRLQDHLQAMAEASATPCASRIELGELVPTPGTADGPLIEKTRREAFDLVVVAKRNHSKRVDRKLGSVSLALIEHCPVPVLVVRPDHGSSSRYVLAATDLTPAGDAAVDLGGLLAEAFDSRLGVLHAWQVPMDVQLDAARVGDEETARRKHAIAEDARTHVLGHERIRHLGDCDVLLSCEPPDDAILAAVASRDPDLVALGSVSRGGLAGLLLGNTAEKLLYRLDCSLLTVKPDDSPVIRPVPDPGSSVRTP